MLIFSSYDKQLQAMSTDVKDLSTATVNIHEVVEFLHFKEVLTALQDSHLQVQASWLSLLHIVASQPPLMLASHASQPP